MIERRVRVVVAHPPAKIWGSLFPANGFEFIWQRITGKPREAIRLASICLETARSNKHEQVADTDMVAAFREFSKERLEDVGSEMEYLFPAFTGFLRHFSGYHKEFRASQAKEAVDKAILKTLGRPKAAVQVGRRFRKL